MRRYRRTYMSVRQMNRLAHVRMVEGMKRYRYLAELRKRETDARDELLRWFRTAFLP